MGSFISRVAVTDTYPYRMTSCTVFAANGSMCSAAVCMLRETWLDLLHEASFNGDKERKEPKVNIVFDIVPLNCWCRLHSLASLVERRYHDHSTCRYIHHDIFTVRYLKSTGSSTASALIPSQKSEDRLGMSGCCFMKHGEE